MTRLNLLGAAPPAVSRRWRHYVLAALLAGIAAGHLQQAQHLTHLTATVATMQVRANDLAQQLHVLQRRTAAASELRLRRDLLERLGRERGRSSNVLYSLERMLPDEVWLAELDYGPRGLEIAGRSQSTTAIMDLLRQLRHLDRLDGIDLLELRRAADSHYHFKAAARPTVAEDTAAGDTTTAANS